MREPPVPGWKAITTKEKVFIPAYHGEGAIEVAEIEVPAWEDPESGEIFLDDRATQKLEEVKARHMGLLSPEQIRDLREHLGMTQQELSLLLQLGERSWSRWENGRERPSRSMNVLLCALYDGKINIHYLRELQDPLKRASRQWKLTPAATRRAYVQVSPPPAYTYETDTIAA